MDKRKSITAFSFGVMLFTAVPAGSVPAPVPEDVPVALMVDLSTGQTLFEKEPNRRFVPASIVKVMTAYTAFRLMDEGSISPSTPVPISQELEDEWSGEGSSMFLLAGEVPTFGELLLGATTVSGNDASVALAEAAAGSVEEWIALMNANAAELGMRNTHFGSANGYPDEGRTFTTAHDLALLAQAAVTRYPDLYRRYFGNLTLTWRNLTQSNHDPITGRVAGADGLKTGFTSEAGYTFLGSGERDGRRLVMVLAGVPTYGARTTTSRAFMEWGFSDFETRSIAPGGLEVGTALVQNGSQQRVRLRLAEDLRLSLPKGGAGQISTTILYQGPVVAPITEGTPIARFRVTVADMAPFEVPLLAGENVSEANFWQRIQNGLKGLFD